MKTLDIIGNGVKLKGKKHVLLTLPSPVHRYKTLQIGIYGIDINNKKLTPVVYCNLKKFIKHPNRARKDIISKLEKKIK